MSPDARQRLDSLTERLNCIADWKDDLRAKIAAAREEFESSLDPGDVEGLRKEVDSFTAACRGFRS